MGLLELELVDPFNSTGRPVPIGGFAAERRGFGTSDGYGNFSGKGNGNFGSPARHGYADDMDGPVFKRALPVRTDL